MRLLIGYDGSEPARAAIAAAAALFPRAETVVVNVQAPPPTLESGALARVALPDAVIHEGIERMRDESDRRARATASEGAALAREAGLRASDLVVQSLSAWRALSHEARRAEAGALVCGTSGDGAIDRVLLGCTASSLLHHATLPLLVVPAVAAPLDGPVLAGFDASEGSRQALRFAAAELRERPLVVAHAWHSPVRHSLRGHALARSHIEMLEDYAQALDTIWAEIAEETAGEGVAFARTLGLSAEPSTPESGYAVWQTVLQGARAAGAAAILVGSRGRGAVTSTLLGSVTSGLVHAAALPVLVVPG